ncbi:HAD-like protein [Xylariaceae sp. FL0255]|nr:HAD-like protein [Xylariaceae sp. FL0255]
MQRLFSTMSKTAPRRFAPLKTSTDQTSNLPRLQGIIFDVDGTLCLPQNYMFAEMRQVLKISKQTDILGHITTLPTPEERESAMESIRAIERRAMSSQTPQPGLLDLMTYLESRKIRRAICTRNFEQPVTHLLTQFLPSNISRSFAPVITRDFSPPKPHPAGLLFIARSWGLGKDGTGSEVASTEEEADASSLIMVGDSVDDMTAGRRAGAATVLLVNDENAHLAEHAHTDLVIRTLDELIGVLEDGFMGREIPNPDV